MTWLSDGEPIHHCDLPEIHEWSTGDPDEGFGADDGLPRDDDSTWRHVHSGARWECWKCDTVHVLAADGTWSAERKGGPVD